MFRSLLRIRYLAAVVVVVFAIHGVGFLVLGVLRGYQVYSRLLTGGTLDEHPGRHIAESVDALLFALVLIVLSLGTASLFLSKPGREETKDLPGWMHIKNLTELKLLLWEAILATLVVTAAAAIIGDLPHLVWGHLVIPISILILSVSYYLLKHSEAKDHRGE